MGKVGRDGSMRIRTFSVDSGCNGSAGDASCAADIFNTEAPQPDAVSLVAELDAVSPENSTTAGLPSATGIAAFTAGDRVRDGLDGSRWIVQGVSGTTVDVRPPGATVVVQRSIACLHLDIGPPLFDGLPRRRKRR